MKMTPRRLTQLLVMIAVLIIIIYDVAAFYVGGVDATISRVTLAWSKDWPVIPFGVGVVSGHLFWSQPKPVDPNKLV